MKILVLSQFFWPERFAINEVVLQLNNAGHEVLEKDPSIKQWMKPRPNQFKLYDNEGNPYQPDFVVEMQDRILIIETKRADGVCLCWESRRASVPFLYSGV